MNMHKHHIVPRYAGGTDDPSNLVLLTEEQHIQAHEDLYVKNENWQDLVAIHRLTKGKGISLTGDKNPMAQPVNREKHRVAMKKRRGGPNGFAGKTHTDETKLKIGLNSSKHQSGSGNSQAGKMWITNGTVSKKIYKHEPITEGWHKGRDKLTCN